MPTDVVGPTEVQFSDGSSAEYDVIVFATGYRQRFPFLFAADGIQQCSDGGSRCDTGGGTAGGDSMRNAHRDTTMADDPLPTQRNICSSDEPTLAFLGFVRPNVGAIPPMAEMQVMWWVQRLRGRLAKPLAAPTYHLLGGNPRTTSYSCDYGAYMHDLARDMGAMPDLLYWAWRRPRVAFTYAMGQAYVSCFRLQGPFASRQCEDTVAVELFRPTMDRGIITNLLFGAIILLFGAINAGAWTLARLVSLFLWMVSLFTGRRQTVLG